MMGRGDDAWLRYTREWLLSVCCHGATSIWHHQTRPLHQTPDTYCRTHESIICGVTHHMYCGTHKSTICGVTDVEHTKVLYASAQKAPCTIAIAPDSMYLSIWHHQISQPLHQTPLYYTHRVKPGPKVVQINSKNERPDHHSKKDHHSKCPDINAQNTEFHCISFSKYGVLFVCTQYAQASPIPLPNTTPPG